MHLEEKGQITANLMDEQENGKCIENGYEFRKTCS
jgi:hypothetical protein